MLPFVRADWLRIRRRWEVWVIVVGVVLLALIGYLNGAADAGRARIPFDQAPPDLVDQMRLENAVQSAQAAWNYQFPQSIVTAAMGGGWLIFGAAFLSATLIGAEFSWGTVRNVVLMRPGRVAYIAVRMGYVIALVLVAFVLICLVGVVLPVVGPVRPADDALLRQAIASGTVDPTAILPSMSLAGAIALASTFLVAALAGTGLAGALAIAFRSGAGAILGAGAYALGELFVGSWMLRAPQPLPYVPQLMLTWRIQALARDISAAVSPQPADTSIPGWIQIEPLLGAAIVAAWLVAIYAAWFVLFKEKDIHE